MCLAVAGFALLPGAAWGLETKTFGMEPYPSTVSGSTRQSYRLELRADQGKRDGVRVFNKSSEPITLRLYPVEAARRGDGSVLVGLSRATTGAGSWIALETEQVTLGPKESKTVAFAVQVPREFPEGNEFLAAIAVEPAPGQASSGVAVVQRLATVVYVERTTILEQVVSSPLTWVALAMLLVVGGAVCLRGAHRRAARQGFVPELVLRPGDILPVRPAGRSGRGGAGQARRVSPVTPANAG